MVLKGWRIDPYLIALVAIIVGFIAFKVPFLDLPFYWDEAWVYAPAAKAMYHNGMSLFPDAIDIKLSRGHPLMFHFLCGGWMHVFGPSRTSLHVFALAISVGLLMATFWLGSTIASKQVGLAATLLVALNETFLAQSGLLLPEMLLALFMLLATGSYITRNGWGYVGFAFGALMTKESALILVLALLTWQVIALLSTSDRSLRNEDRRWLLILPLPVILASSFFILQKLKFGWFFFPDHLGLMTWDLKDVIYKIKLGYTGLLETQGMQWVTYTFAFVALVLWREVPLKRSLPAVLLYVAAIKILFGRWPLPPLATVVVTATCFAAVFWLVDLPFYRRDKDRGAFNAIGVILVLGFLIFSSLNFFTDRYLLCLIPFVALGMLSFMEAAFLTRHKFLFPGFVAVFACLLFIGIGQDGKVGDTRLSYADDVRTHQQMIAYLEGKGLFDATIQGSFMDIAYMTDPEAGYLSRNRSFSNVHPERDQHTRYVLCASSTPGSEYAEVKRSDLILIERFDSGHAWTEIYAAGRRIGSE